MSYSSGISYCMACAQPQQSYSAHSALEAAVHAYQPVQPAKHMADVVVFDDAETKQYQQKQYSKHYTASHADYTPSGFVNAFVDLNQPAVFVADQELEDYVKETFQMLTGKSFPADVSVHIVEESKLKELHEHHGGQWHPHIQGFALNRKGFGTSDIFIKKDRLDATMLTIGHELGHVLSFALPNPIDEEAKAFAFSLAWMETIQKNNIGNIRFKPFSPSKNGIHDKAFSFVQHLLKQGKHALEIVHDLATLKHSIEV